MADKSASDKKEPAPKPAGFDRGSQDFFRGRQGLNQFRVKANNRSFIGMRRGSR